MSVISVKKIETRNYLVDDAVFISSIDYNILDLGH